MSGRGILACLALWGLGMSSPARAEPVETPVTLDPDAAVARTLASERYRFCFDRKYPLWDEEVRWCSLLPRSPDPRATRCPGFVDACRAGATARLAPREAPLDVHLPNFGGLGQLVLWAMAAVAVAGLVVLLVRAGMKLAQPRSPKARREGPAQAPVASGGHRDVEIERDVDRLLARARAAAQAGDYLAAVSDLRAALLRRLEGDGHVRIHPSATNGDYVRELRQRAPALAAPVDQVVRDVERVEFGDEALAGAAYQSVLSRLEPLLLRSAGRLMVLVAACSLALSCQPSGRPDWAHSPSGSAAVAQVLTAVGLNARERIHPLKDLAREAAADVPRQVLVLPDAQMGEPEWTALRDWLTDESHTLVVAAGSMRLPPWLAGVEAIATGATEELRAGEGLLALAGEEEGTGDDEEGEEEGDDGGEDRGEETLMDFERLRGRVPGGAWLRSDVNVATTLIARGPRAYAVELDTAETGAADAGPPRGRVVVLADDRLLVNAALVVADNAALLTALLDAGGKPLEIVNAETGLVAPNPVAAVTRGRLAPFLLQLGACLTLFLLLRGRAFGRLVDRDIVTRRAFGEHVRAVGMQYARARAAGHALGSYAAWATERLRERIRLSGDRGLGDLAGAVAARTGRPLGDVARVLFSARRDSDAPDPGPEDRSRAGAQQHLSMMRELGRLLTETLATSVPSRRTATGPATAVPVAVASDTATNTGGTGTGSNRTPTQKGIPTS